MVDKTIHYTCPTGGMCSTPSAQGITAVTWNCGSGRIGCIFVISCSTAISEIYTR